MVPSAKISFIQGNFKSDGTCAIISEMVDEEKLRAELKRRLSPERFAHSLRVAILAESLAKKLGADPAKGRLAGLFHDIARYHKGPALLMDAKRYGLVPDSFQQNDPKLIHADVSAEIAREEFGVTDDEILQAIRRHTLGSSQMAILDKVLYLADHLEPGRRLSWSASILQLAETDLDAAIAEAAKKTLEFVLQKNGPIHPRTVDTWNQYNPHTR